MIRLAEIILIRAESNFMILQAGGQIAGTNSPTIDINLLRYRAGASLYEEPVTLDQIRNERYLELCWEGFRLHDLKRWQMNIGDLSYDAGNLILPIPQQEMEINSLLVQNPFYQ